MTGRSRRKPAPRKPARRKPARKPARKAGRKAARKAAVSVTRSLPASFASGAATPAAAAALSRITIPAGRTTFAVTTTRLLSPFTVGLDAMIFLTDLVSAERTVDLSPGTHGMAFVINHIEDAWEHAFNIRPSSGPAVPVDHKSKAAGDGAVTALVLDVVAS